MFVNVAPGGKTIFGVAVDPVGVCFVRAFGVRLLSVVPGKCFVFVCHPVARWAICVMQPRVALRVAQRKLTFNVSFRVCLPPGGWRPT